MFFFYIVISIFFGLPGMIFFALGLIHRKPGQWITGIVLTFVALIILVYSIVSMVQKSVKFINNISKNEFKHSHYYNSNHDNNTYYDSLEVNEQVTNDYADDKGVSGFVKGIDNKLTLIHVKINNQLEVKGVTIGKIDDYTPQSIKRNGIAIKLNFSEDFKGKISLTGYNYNNDEISSCTISCSAINGENQSVEFDYNKEVDLSDFNYCILTESVQ